MPCFDGLVDDSGELLPQSHLMEFARGDQTSLLLPAPMLITAISPARIWSVLEGSGTERGGSGSEGGSGSVGPIAAMMLSPGSSPSIPSTSPDSSPWLLSLS